MRYGYPRPQFKRKDWISLNGPWDFAIDVEARWREPENVQWKESIVVPFSPETEVSGIANTGFYRRLWYRRTCETPPLQPGQRLILHFEAVDYAAKVWVNRSLAVRHTGGYTRFSADITHLIDETGKQEIVVRADDDPHGLDQPRGKQDWMLEPHAIWYPRTSGIWQTVWLEILPETSIAPPRWTPNLELWEFGLETHLEGLKRDELRLNVDLHIGNYFLARDSYEIFSGETTRRIVLSDPGIDDYRNELLWSPPSPTLITARLKLTDKKGQVIDKAYSYTALRSLSIQGERLILNGRPYPLRLVLDQGYWPESGLTPPDDDALRRDVELTKAMGFNGVRKHQKIESERYLYWADRLGLLVWEEMPSAYRFTRTSVTRLAEEWMKVIERDYSHPCIIAWVPFNESWGVPNLPEISSQRHYVQGIYHLTKTLDPTRPVIGNDGWESVATDIIGIHDYDDSPEKIAARYVGDERIPHLFKRERPGGKLLTLEGSQPAGQPIVLTEFGGIALAQEEDPNVWGHSRAKSPEDLAHLYTRLLEVVRSRSMLAGFCYTQFADTYQEKNGLLYDDRTPKFPVEQIHEGTRGKPSPRDQHMYEEWRARMQRFKQDVHAFDDPYPEEKEDPEL